MCERSGEAVIVGDSTAVSAEDPVHAMGSTCSVTSTSAVAITVDKDTLLKTTIEDKPLTAFQKNLLCMANRRT